MDEFCVRCNCKNRRFTGCKSRFLQAADCAKFATDAAAELCGIALSHFSFVRRKNAGQSNEAKKHVLMCHCIIDFRQCRTDEVVQMWMNFAQDATAKIEGLLAVNRDFCRKQIG